MAKTGGWYNDRQRHRLAARGVKTATRSNVVKVGNTYRGTRELKLYALASELDSASNELDYHASKVGGVGDGSHNVGAARLYIPLDKFNKMDKQTKREVLEGAARAFQHMSEKIEAGTNAGGHDTLNLDIYKDEVKRSLNDLRQEESSAIGLSPRSYGKLKAYELMDMQLGQFSLKDVI